MIAQYFSRIFLPFILVGMSACQIEVERSLNVTPSASVLACTTDVINAVLDKNIDYIVENWDERWRENVSVSLTERVVNTLYADSFNTEPQYVSTQRSDEKNDEAYYTIYHIPHKLGRDEILIGVYEDEQRQCSITELTVNFNTDKPFNALKKPEKRTE